MIVEVGYKDQNFLIFWGSIFFYSFIGKKKENNNFFEKIQKLDVTRPKTSKRAKIMKIDNFLHLAAFLSHTTPLKWPKPLNYWFYIVNRELLP